MTKAFYFKVAFLAVSIGLFTSLLLYGLLVYFLLDKGDFSNIKELTNIFLRSLIICIGTGLILGILNMFLKIGNFQNKKHKSLK